MPSYRCNLACGFCFAKDMHKLYPDDLSLEDLNRLLDWLHKQDIKTFSILGGEPTIYPHFKEMLEVLKNRGFKTTLFTNALFSEEAANAIAKASLKGLVITYNPEKCYTKDQFKILNRNLDFLYSHNIIFKPSYNVSIDNLDYGYIIDICKKYYLKQVRIALSSPNSPATNSFLTWDDQKKAAGIVFAAIFDLHKLGIRCSLDGCVPPLCIFSQEQRIFLQNNVPNFEGVCSGVIDINPDLSVYLCLPLSSVKLGDITKYNSIDEVRKLLLSKVSDLMWNQNVIEDCRTCRYKVRKACIGGSCRLKEVILSGKK